MATIVPPQKGSTNQKVSHSRQRRTVGGHRQCAVPCTPVPVGEFRRSVAEGNSTNRLSLGATKFLCPAAPCVVSRRAATRARFAKTVACADGRASGGRRRRRRTSRLDADVPRRLCELDERTYGRRRKLVVGRVGLEPTTNGLRVHCSTN